MASSSAKAFLSLFLAIAFEAAGVQPDSNTIGSGSSLYPTTKPTIWHSPSNRFAFGFFPEGNGYRVGIWIVGSGNNSTVVWTANRDRPVVSLNARLDFVDGKIQLKPENGPLQIIADPSEPAVSASLLDSGNFVLYNQYGKIVWESFQYPTDTILGGQYHDSGSELISSVSPVNHSSGRFRLKMQYDGNLAAYPVNTADDSVDGYWSSHTVRNIETHLFLNNDSGVLQLITSSIMTLNLSIYRATLGYDGNFRLFSHIFDGENC